MVFVLRWKLYVRWYLVFYFHRLEGAMVDFVFRFLLPKGSISLNTQSVVIGTVYHTRCFFFFLKRRFVENGRDFGTLCTYHTWHFGLLRKIRDSLRPRPATVSWKHRRAKKVVSYGLGGLLLKAMINQNHSWIYRRAGWCRSVVTFSFAIPRRSFRNIVRCVSRCTCTYTYMIHYYSGSHHTRE